MGQRLQHFSYMSHYRCYIQYMKFIGKCLNFCGTCFFFSIFYPIIDVTFECMISICKCINYYGTEVAAFFLHVPLQMLHLVYEIYRQMSQLLWDMFFFFNFLSHNKCYIECMISICKCINYYGTEVAAFFLRVP